MQARKKDVKKAIDADEARRKREENIIELRKAKRDENLLKKRQTFAAPQYALEDSTKGSVGGGQRVRIGSKDRLFAVVWLQHNKP
jgi:importin subunit alpha-6/7